MRILTIGFTEKGARTFFESLRDAGVKKVIDVRLNRASQLSGFAKQNKQGDLSYFLERLCGIGYAHMEDLAPEKDMLDNYKKKGGPLSGDWSAYARRFNALLAERRIEDAIAPQDVADSCLLCSEHKPHYCHRRLVAEYLKEKWGAAGRAEVTIEHLPPGIERAETRAKKPRAAKARAKKSPAAETPA